MLVVGCRLSVVACWLLVVGGGIGVGVVGVFGVVGVVGVNGVVRVVGVFLIAF